MLPNWLLGKSKSKLIEELGGGGGGTSYTAGDGIDISNGVISFDPETTPAIDPSKIDGLDNDLAALAPKTALSNPNILHNPWFTVNQREFTTTSTDNTFVADRWKCNANGGTFVITRNSDGTYTIDNTNNANDLIIQQKRTAATARDLNGKKLTASIEFSDGTIKSGTKTFTSNANVTYLDEVGVFNLAAWPATNNTFFLLIVKPGASITIKALKLEVGEISTLHLDPRPEYAIELAKCQRYFQRISNASSHAKYVALGLAQGTTYFRVGINYVAKMRTNPSVTITGKIYAGLQGSTDTLIEVTKVSEVIGPDSSYIVCSATGLIDKQVYILYLEGAAHIDFNAEL